jgi:hypothetical protein
LECERVQSLTVWSGGLSAYLYITGFAVKVFEGAVKGDSICVQAFQKAGTDLARHIVAIVRLQSTPAPWHF